MKNKLYLGLNFGLHDSSICLFDGISPEIILSERLTRKKKEGGFPLKPLLLYKDDLNQQKYEISFNALGRKIKKQVDYWNELYPFTKKMEHLKLSAFDPSTNLAMNDYTHHLCHAYSALFHSPFNKSLILVIDGFGSAIENFEESSEKIFYNFEKNNSNTLEHVLTGEHFSVYTQNQGNLNCVRKSWAGLYLNKNIPTDFIHASRKEISESIGIFYENMAHFVFGSKYDTGKLMGLSAFGSDDNSTKSFLNYQINLDWSKSRQKESWANLKLVTKEFYSNIAKKTQNIYEDYLTVILLELKKEYPEYDNLIITGGCALNCVANSKIMDLKIFESVYVPPFPSDEGISFGASYADFINSVGTSEWSIQKSELQVSSFGSKKHDYGQIDLKTTLENKFGDKFQIQKSQTIAKDVAKLLHNNNIIAWIQGRSECGPRALGNRSILSSVTFPDLKNYLNKNIKFREDFRPYGGTCLLEKAHIYFDWQKDLDNSFMSFAPKIRDQYLDILNPIAHVDNTSRMQTLRREQNSRFYDLINEYGNISGIYCLLNTSLNVMGEPIVETLEDAFRFFESSKVNILVIEDFIITKSNYA